MTNEIGKLEMEVNYNMVSGSKSKQDGKKKNFYDSQRHLTLSIGGKNETKNNDKGGPEK